MKVYKDEIRLCPKCQNAARPSTRFWSTRAIRGIPGQAAGQEIMALSCSNCGFAWPDELPADAAEATEGWKGCTLLGLAGLDQCPGCGTLAEKRGCKDCPIFNPNYPHRACGDCAWDEGECGFACNEAMPVCAAFKPKEKPQETKVCGQCRFWQQLKNGAIRGHCLNQEAVPVGLRWKARFDVAHQACELFAQSPLCT